MMMTRAGSGLALSVAAFLTVGCGSPTGLEGPTASESAATNPTGPSAEALTGIWIAELSHAGATTDFMLELEGDAVVRAFISIPAIDLWRQAIGTTTISGTTVRAGSIELMYEDDGPLLVGNVPRNLVPLQGIPLVLRPGERLQPMQSEIEALPAPEPLWTFETGGPIWAGITVDRDLVLAASDDGFVYALGLDGTERWRFEVGAVIRAAPVAAGDSVLIHADDGVLYKIDRATGELTWASPLTATPAPRVPPGSAQFRYDHYASAPAVDGVTAYVAHDNEVHSLELADGRIRWTATLGDISTSTPALADGRVIVGSFDGRVYALDAENGAVVWSYDTGAPVPSSPAVGEGLVLIGSRSYDMLALRLEDGSPAWRYYNWFSWVESSAVVDDGTAYVGSSDLQLIHALDAATGSVRWQFDSGGSAWASPAVAERAVFAGTVGVAGYIIDHSGGFFAIERASGEGIWRFPLERPRNAAMWGFGSAPAVGGNVVVAGGLDGRLYAFPLE